MMDTYLSVVIEAIEISIEHVTFCDLRLRIRNVVVEFLNGHPVLRLCEDPKGDLCFDLGALAESREEFIELLVLRHDCVSLLEEYCGVVLIRGGYARGQSRARGVAIGAIL